MSAPAPLRIGLVGCGRLAEHGYVPACASLDVVHLAAVADPDPERRDHLAARAGAGVASFPDTAAMVSAGHLDAVVVASPVHCHLDDARRAVDAGLPVLVEKPPAPDAVGAGALAALHPAPWVGFNRRFAPGARRVRDAARAVSGNFDVELALSYRRRSWRAHSVHDDALLDLGPHLVDWATWITDSPVTAVRTAECTPDRAVVTLKLARGRARIRATCDGTHREQIGVWDASGTRVARDRTGGLADALRGRIAPGPHPLVASLAAQLRAFAATIRHHPAPHPDLATAQEAAMVMAVLDAARASAADGGRWTSIVGATER